MFDNTVTEQVPQEDVVLELSDPARITAGVVLLTVVAIESGGFFLLKVFGGRLTTTDLQKSFYRAGHAHAGVLVILGLLCLLLTEATDLSGFAHWLAATGVLWAAVLMPAGFFFSAMGEGRTSPNRAVVLLPVGAVVLAAGVVTLAAGLLLG
jgi:Ni,Fe-hydrogenase I cytochrome b subunit